MTDSDPPLPELAAPPVAPSAAVSDAIIRRVHADLAPARGWSSGTRLGLSSLVAIAVMVGFVALEGEGAVALLAAGGVLAVSVVLATRAGAGLRSAPRQRAAALALLLCAAFATVMARGQGEAAPTAHGLGMGCAVAALGLGAAVALVGAWIWRRTDPFFPALSAAGLGLAAATSGVFAVTAVCPQRDPTHLLVAHAAGLVVLPLLTAVFGRRLLSP